MFQISNLLAKHISGSLRTETETRIS